MSRSLDSTKPAVWRARFERFFDCGLAVARFCAREGVSVASFYLWRKKLGAHGRRTLRPPLGHRGRRRRMTEGHPPHRTDPTGGRGVFQQVAVVPPARGFIPVASSLVSAGRAVCIQMPCGTRIEVGADDLDAVRTVVAEVVRAYRGREAGVA
jgi:hypothetical protein